MLGMQYKVMLPHDYDMKIIRNRVKETGFKMDGFSGLHFKAYLITEAGKLGNFNNSYAPFYIWNDTEGMNKFVFEGFFDNILNSFGWQKIHIEVPRSIKLDEGFTESKYIVETLGTIQETISLTDLRFVDVNPRENSLGTILLYNPENWSYRHINFYKEKPELNLEVPFTVYEILYISR